MGVGGTPWHGHVGLAEAHCPLSLASKDSCGRKRFHYCWACHRCRMAGQHVSRNLKTSFGNRQSLIRHEGSEAHKNSLKLLIAAAKRNCGNHDRAADTNQQEHGNSGGMEDEDLVHGDGSFGMEEEADNICDEAAVPVEPENVPERSVWQFGNIENYSAHLKKAGKIGANLPLCAMENSGMNPHLQEANRNGEAAKFIVDNAIKGGKVASHSMYNVSTSECLMTLLLTKITLKLPEAERNMLAAVINHMAAGNKDMNPNQYIPINGQDMHNVLVKAEYSVMNNVAAPKATITQKGGYAYVSLTDSLRVQFASDKPPHMFHIFEKTLHSQHPRGKELLADFALCPVKQNEPGLYPVKLILWSDGFQCFNVTVNTNAAAHACFATMGAEDGDMSGK